MPGPDERDEALGRLLRDAVAAEPGAGADARARLDAAWGALPPPRRRMGWRTWLFAPRLSPLGALGLAGAAAALTLVLVRATAPRAASPVAVQAVAAVPTVPVRAAAARAGAEAGAVITQFTLEAPGARRVALVGDFNGWDPTATPLAERDGAWRVAIPLGPGRHAYGFVVDDSQWVADPASPRESDADFGGSNSVIWVGVTP